MAPKVVLNGVISAHDAEPDEDVCGLPLGPPGVTRFVHAEVVSGREADDFGDADETVADGIDDFEEAFDRGYDLLQEVEEQIDFLLEQSGIAFTRRTHAKLVGLQEAISEYLTAYEG